MRMIIKMIVMVTIYLMMMMMIMLLVSAKVNLLWNENDLEDEFSWLSENTFAKEARAHSQALLHGCSLVSDNDHKSWHDDYDDGNERALMTTTKVLTMM